MESKWRYNVADFGWSNSGVRLAARSLGSPSIAYTAGTPVGEGVIGILAWQGPVLGWVYTAYAPIPPAFPHFPYGLAVESD